MYEQIVADDAINDETEDDAADETPMDDDADEAPDDEDCNDVCLCSASVLSTEMRNKVLSIKGKPMFKILR